MSKVIIMKMALHYFKGIRNLDVAFNDGETKIIGPNGSGKSTIADAFNWLLFGKNAAGESDTKFLIKTVDENGEEIPHVEHSVEAMLSVDEHIVTLRRVLIPDYGKNDELKGNHTEYYWNDVPVKKSEYDAKVKGIIEESVFRIITSPTAFLTMEWKKQREMLMSMAGDIDENAIAEQDERFKELVACLEEKGISLDEYKAALKSHLSRVIGRMDSIPPRIDEVSMGIQDVHDYDALIHEKEDIKAKMSAIDREAADLTEKSRIANSERLEMQAGINRMLAEQARIIDEEEKRLREDIRQQNLKHDEAKMRYNALIDENLNLGKKLRSDEEYLRNTIRVFQNQSLRIAEDMQKLRDEWKRVNAMEFSAEASLICPLFNKACHDSDACSRYDNEQGAAFDAFCNDKMKKLEAITNKGMELKADMEAINPEIEKIEHDIASLKQAYNENVEKNNVEIAELEKFLEEHPRLPLIAHANARELPEWVELQDKIEKMQKSMPEHILTSTEDFSIISRKNELAERLTEISKEIAKKERADQMRKRIQELEGELRWLGEQKAELDAGILAANDFEVAKMDAVSNRVNGMFSLVTWQMFQKQVNGESIPACIALVNGVRWSDANNAARINAGIDVAATLARAKGVSAPMFIDNTESVADVYDPGQQQRILLEFDRKAKFISFE